MTLRFAQTGAAATLDVTLDGRSDPSGTDGCIGMGIASRETCALGAPIVLQKSSWGLSGVLVTPKTSLETTVERAGKSVPLADLEHPFFQLVVTFERR